MARGDYWVNFLLAHLQGHRLWLPGAQLKGILVQSLAEIPVGGYSPGMLILYQAAMIDLTRSSLN